MQGMLQEDRCTDILIRMLACARKLSKTYVLTYPRTYIHTYVHTYFIVNVTGKNLICFQTSFPPVIDRSTHTNKHNIILFLTGSSTKRPLDSLEYLSTVYHRNSIRKHIWEKKGLKFFEGHRCYLKRFGLRFFLIAWRERKGVRKSMV